MTVISLQNNRRSLVVVAVIIASALSLVAPVAKAESSTGAIAQGFKAGANTEDVVAGALMSFKKNDSQSVELATSSTVDQLIGVVGQTPLVVISGNDKEVQVVLSGTTNILVSDINGPIGVSDKITASPIAGVGMLATSNSRVVGTAQSSFDTRNSTTHTVTDDRGQAHTVHIGTVPLQVGVAFYQAPGSEFLPPFIQNLADSIAGRSVSLIRVLLASALLLLGFIVITVLVYTSVRTALTSLGRNPLAAGAIRKSLYQVVIVAVAVLGGTLLAIYLILIV